MRARFPTSWNFGVWATGCVLLGVLLGVVAGVLIGGALAPPVTADPWLKTYGSLVGAAIGAVVSIGAAIAAAAVAIRNVLRQMRINLMIREEDRMEKLMPGIVAASLFLRELGPRLIYSDPKRTLELLEEAGLKGDINVAVRKKLKSSEGVVQQRSAQMIESIIDRAKSLMAVRDKLEHERTLTPSDDPNFAAGLRPVLTGYEQQEREGVDQLRRAISELLPYSEKLMERARAYRHRLPRFRTEIEQYFAGGGGSRRD